MRQPERIFVETNHRVRSTLCHNSVKEQPAEGAYNVILRNAVTFTVHLTEKVLSRKISVTAERTIDEGES
jgi:hypothetical protein